MAQLSDFVNYVGDVNLEYGGLFVNLDDWEHGYADCLRVTDLSNGGFDGAVEVERITALFGHGWKQQMQGAVESCGLARIVKGMDIRARKLALVDSLVRYGLYDPVSDMTGPHSWIIQTDPDEDYAPMSYDGWIADTRLDEDTDLFEYLYNEGYLSEFE